VFGHYNWDGTEQPMEWVGRMNNIRSRAEEIVMEEVINTL
jgi:hypothetical protein